MSFINAADSSLSKLYSYLCADRKRTVLSALVIYLIMFVIFALVSLYPTAEKIGTLLGVDGVGQYYPFLLDFRRNLIDFFESVKSGNPQFRMINFGFFLGTDTISTTTVSFIPFLPYYIFVALVPENAVPAFLSVGAVLLSFIAGLSFIYLCSHFKKNLLLSGFMAVFYVFCGNYFFTGLWNPHFLYMYIAFPLMIAGIDRIITEKGWLLFTLSVAWLSVAGLQLLVYTLPFVIIFASIRTYFLYKGRYFKSLGKYFLRGSLATVLGLALSGATLLIFLQNFFASVRSQMNPIADMAELLTPSVDYLTELLGLSESNTPAGICAALIPCFIYMLTSVSVKREIRTYSFTLLLLTAFPVVRYGLNFFRYELCRWGFIPALFISFGCVSYLPRLVRLRKNERRTFFFTLLTYTLLLTVRADTAAIVFLLIMSVINSVPFLRKRLRRTVKTILVKLKAFFAGGRIISLAAVTVLSLGLIIGCILIVSFRHYRIEPLLLAAAAVFVAVSAFGSRKNLSLTAMILCCAVIGTIHINSEYSDSFKIQENYVAKAVAELEKEENTFGRSSALYNDCFIVGFETETATVPEDSEKGEESVEEEQEIPSNRNLVYGIVEPEIFASMINGNYMNFIRRCGQEMASVYSTGQLEGFGAKEELYSLFGVDVMYADISTDAFYGITPVDKITVEDGSEIYLYKNSYALPAGVTYSGLMNKDAYESLNPAELPFAMMDSVYLEGYDASTYQTGNYSWECGYDIKQELRGQTINGKDCYDNYVTPKEDLSGCFVYLSFEGVDCRFLKGARGVNVFFDIDGEKRTFTFHNANSDWEWTYYTDHYTLPLGYQQDGINEISFISPFTFESMKIYAVPEDVYINAYNNCVEEVLQNIEMSVNTLTGDITVSSDKVLSINMLYSDGWTAYVDGKETPVYKANGLFLGIPLEKGTHTVRLSYRTPLLYEGFAVSAVTVAAIIAAKLLEKRRKKI